MKVEPALVQSACAGDVQAMEQLLAQSRPDLKRFAIRVCATREDAEDAVQLALWKVHTHIGTLRSIGAYAAWVFRIVEHECRKLFRSQREQALDDELLAQLEQRYDSPDEFWLDLSKMLAALSAKDSEILILRDILEWTTPEAATHLGITPEAAKSRLHRARALLREQLVGGKYDSSREDRAG